MARVRYSAEVPMLTSEGFVVVPRFRASHEVVLEGWLHYDEQSYRFYRWEPGPVAVTIGNNDGDPVVQFRRSGGPSPRLDVAVTFSEVNNPLFRQTLKAAAHVQQVGEHWVVEVTAPTDEEPTIRQKVGSRAEAVDIADEALSKYLMQDVRQERVDLLALSREVEALRVALRAVVGDVHVDPEAPNTESKYIPVHNGDIRRAQRVLGMTSAARSEVA